MQEVKGFLLHGEVDYSKLRGETGPLVYPAGFVYIYSGIYYLTNGNIFQSQIIFVFLYLLTLFVVSLIYRKSGSVPLFSLILLCLSKRIHSIFVLRLFNDPFSIFFMFISILLLMNRKFITASVFYSLALSIKMNILLFLPSFGVILLSAVGVWKTFLNCVVIILVQLILGYPFLSTFPREYLMNAFNFQRAFLYKWTVNWKFLSPDLFSSPYFAHVLFFSYILGSLLMVNRFCKSWITLDFHVPLKSYPLLLFTNQLLGIITSRTLHYQFYSWYFFTIPFLLWRTRFHPILKCVLFFAIEYCWNVYPSTPSSSALLFFSNVTLLIGVWLNMSKQQKIK